MFSLGAIVSFSAFFLSGCEKAALLNPKGLIAADELKLLITSVLLMLIIVLPVLILVGVMAYRYRASNKKAKYQPGFHSVKLEVFWWFFPIVIIAFLAVVTWKSTHYLDPYRPLDSTKKPITIQVVSLNWRWLFIYPEQQIATINYLEFPVDTPINFKLTSDAPMNSFVIRQLGGQIYTMAGMQTKLSLIANEAGNYQGMALGFSGDGFDKMFFNTKVVDAPTFDAWVNSVKKSANILNFSTYARLVPDSQDTSVMYFKLGDNRLFYKIMDKYMSPDMSASMSDQR
jgi:cytochrome o ubiquinol oxidase subunit 2